LLGWKIDIKSEEEKRQEVEQQMSALVTSAATPLENVPGLGEGLVEKLSAAGITTVEALADMTPEQLEAIEGIGPKTVEKISLAVNNYFSSLEGGEIATETEAAGEASLDKLSAEADAPVDSPQEAENTSVASEGGETLDSASQETNAASQEQGAAGLEGEAEQQEVKPEKTGGERAE